MGHLLADTQGKVGDGGQGFMAPGLADFPADAVVGGSDLA